MTRPDLMCLGVMIATAALAVIAPPARGQGARVFPRAEWERATPHSQGVDGALLDEAMRLVNDISGKDGNTECLVVRNGYVIWEGPAVGRIHPIFSCTKSYVSTVLGLLVADGTCTPDTRVADVLPKMKAHYPELTLGQLSSLTSGYASDEKGKPATPLFAPGTKFNYDGGPDVLAEALTVLAGRPIAELFDERVARPIGIAGHDWAWSTAGRTDSGVAINGGASGHITNALSFARFGWLMCNDGNWDGRRLVDPAWIRLATTPQYPGSLPTHKTENDGGRWYVRIPGAYGIGWHLNTPNHTGRPRWPSAPPTMFVAQGGNENLCFVVREWNLVLVRGSSNGYNDLEEWDKVLALIGRAVEKGASMKPE